MIEKAITGDKKYYGWLFTLFILIGIGFYFYMRQLQVGLGITGMSRDVTWGFYIAQLTYLVGVAASAVMVVLPYYLHNYKQFGKVTILGEFLAISAVIMCMLFVFVDMGMPTRVTNVILHPTPNSVMFWDMFVLSGYLALNLFIGFVTLGAERKQVPPPKWIKPVIYLSIPWAVSIHTVTAFLYAGLAGRHLWFTAIMAARFLASAFAAGPGILIILIFILRKVSSFKVGKEPVQALAKIVTYAMMANVFFLGLEFFTAYYSGVPSHYESLKYLFFGLHGAGNLAPFMQVSLLLAAIGLPLLIIPRFRRREGILGVGVVAIILGTWIDKGLGLVVGGFIPNPMHEIIEYSPTMPELAISVGIYALGALIVTVLYKIVVSVRQQLA